MEIRHDQPARPGDASLIGEGQLTGNGRAALALAAFQSSPFGFVVLNYDRRSVTWNASARRMVPGIGAGVSCCDLLGCGQSGGPLADGCITELARSRGEQLPEVRVDLESRAGPAAVWLAAAPLAPEHEYVVVQLRPGTPGDRRRRTVPHWVSDSELRIVTLGRTSVESREGPIGGTWLERRSGQLLKLLVAHRRKVVPTDAIIEALWSGGDVHETGNVRFLVHSLRQKVEPDRKRGQSAFIVARQGGYTLDRDRVHIDADVFERYVLDGRAAFVLGDEEAAEQALSAAADLYRGDFLADEPYADWVLAERDRLRALMTDALSVLAQIRGRHGDLEGKLGLAVRLAAMQPYDMEIQRGVLELLLEAGRRSDAVRHYDALRSRMLSAFGEEPTFSLADVRSRT